MGWFNDDSQQANHYNDYSNAFQGDNQPVLSHELIAGAASYEAAKAYENHVAANGQPDSHAKAKEILAGFTGAFVDREVESRGLNYIDRERAKRDATDQAHQALADSGDYGNYSNDSNNY